MLRWGKPRHGQMQQRTTGTIKRSLACLTPECLDPGGLVLRRQTTDIVHLTHHGAGRANDLHGKRHARDTLKGGAEHLMALDNLLQGGGKHLEIDRSLDADDPLGTIGHARCTLL
jgi:hypothetical protein